jgi:ABC-type nitrate/sulfonate/bicarbonate transport system ATPase subunit
MMSAELEVNIQSMRYAEQQDTRNLIQNLRFAARSGSVVSFLGATGAGKTTMFRIIAGLERTYSGSVTLGGAAVRRPSRDVQMVFQDYRLLPWMTVYENIAFALHGNDQAEDSKSIDRWLDILGLVEKRHAYPKSLSGGEAARVALGRVFVSPPKVLLLDEPFRNLDIGVRFELQHQLVAALQTSGTTVLMISHNVEDAVFLSDEIYLLSSRPMSLAHRMSVDLPWPRKHDDLDLGAFAAELTRRILALSELTSSSKMADARFARR